MGSRTEGAPSGSGSEFLAEGNEHAKAQAIRSSVAEGSGTASVTTAVNASRPSSVRTRGGWGLGRADQIYSPRDVPV